MKFIAKFMVPGNGNDEIDYTIYRSEDQYGNVNKYLVVDTPFNDRYLFDTPDIKIINRYQDRAFDTYNEAKYFILYDAEKRKNEELRKTLKQLSA